MTEALSQLFYGDNIEVLRRDIATSSIDLVYLDPPFNSDQVYNVNFAQAGDASAQIQAFDDTWKWTTDTEADYDFLVSQGGLPDRAAETLSAVRALTGPSELTAYMTHMAPRLVELHRALKSTGSLYLHCDPTASHYLKVMLDAIFGPKSFRNEIVWRRTGSHNPGASFGPLHDIVLFYTKSPSRYYFKRIKRPYTMKHVQARYTQQPDGRWKFTSGGNILTGAGTSQGESGQVWRGFDPSVKKRHWAVPGFVTEQMPDGFKELGVLDQLEAAYQAGLIEIIPGRAWPEPVRYLLPDSGAPVGDIWAFQPGTEGTLYGTPSAIDSDVAYLGPTSPERLGYPTQKPVGLLNRILEASCPPDGVVLDPFCGCGTTLDSAVRKHIRWIGIDITFIAVDLIRNRLRLTHGSSIDETYEVLGIPHDLAAAHALFDRDPFEFERWAVSLVRGTPNTKQVSDKGKDGIIRWYRGRRTKPGQIAVSVKGGKQLNPSMVRDLAGTVASNEKLDGGVLITMYDPTSGMKQAANTAGTFTDPAGNTYPKVQLITVPQLLAGTKPRLPMIIPPYTEAKPVDDVIQETINLGI